MVKMLSITVFSMFSPVSICWSFGCFVSRIAQKLQNRSPVKLGWGRGLGPECNLSTSRCDS